MADLSKVAFYGILDTGYVAPQSWESKYDALVIGGAGIIQIRAKRETTHARATLVDRIMRHRASLSLPQPPLVINDDIDLCLAYPDLGLHVGQDDLPATEARQRLGPNRILGLSTHSPKQADAAIALGPNILSYFAVGPVFPTLTKPTYQAVGLKLVTYVAQKQSELPFFCIGGINRGNIAQVIQAGARRIVTVSDVLCDSDTARAVSHSVNAVKDSRPSTR